MFLKFGKVAEMISSAHKITSTDFKRTGKDPIELLQIYILLDFSKWMDSPCYFKPFNKV